MKWIPVAAFILLVVLAGFSDNPPDTLTPRVQALENWRRLYAAPQITKDSISIIQLKQDLNTVNNTVNLLKRQVDSMKNKEYILYVDSSFRKISDSISLLGIKDSIMLRTKNKL